MRREKRSEIVKSRITPSLLEEIEQDLQVEGQLVTLSDWLFDAAEQKLAMKRAIHVSKHRAGRRVGQ